MSATADHPIHVVAGLIRDVRGRVLLARRTRDRDLAGLWEFPGGKVEAGERPQQGLARELREELGIDAEAGALLIAVPQRMPHKRILLEVYEVAGWRGKPRGLDGQALAWVPIAQLPRYAMPPADRPVVAALRQPEHYLVTPTPPEGGEAHWLAGLEQALARGCRRVQLRAPGLDPARWQALAATAAARCRAHGAEVLVNGDEALAHALDAGLHLPAAALMQRRSRDWPDARPLAASCHDAAELAQAERVGCDFVVLGSVFESASHPGRPGIGWNGFARLREQVSLPVYAIGGLGLQDRTAARRHGAQGIAAIRAFWPGD